MNKRITTKGDAIKQAERRAQAISMRKNFLSYQQIGDALGISAQAAYKLVLKEVKQLNTKRKEDAEVVRAHEVARLDELAARLYLKGQGKVVGASIVGMDMAAIDRYCKVTALKAEFQGTMAPKKLEHTGPDGGPIPVQPYLVEVPPMAKSVKEWQEQNGLPVQEPMEVAGPVPRAEDPDPKGT